MGRTSKSHRPPGVLRNILAANVKGLRDKKFRELDNETARNKELGKLAGLHLAQIQRIVAPSLGTSVDYIERLAEALDVKPQDLLTPFFSNTARTGQEGIADAGDKIPHGNGRAANS